LRMETPFIRHSVSNKGKQKTLLYGQYKSVR